MRENSSDIIEVRLSTDGSGVTHHPDTLQVLRNQEVLSFTEQSWMDLQGANAEAKLNYKHLDMDHSNLANHLIPVSQNTIELCRKIMAEQAHP